MQNDTSIYDARILKEAERQKRISHSPYYLEMEVTQRIAMLDEAGALKALNEINRIRRATLAESPLRSLKNSLIGSCTIFARAAILGGAHVEAAFELSDICIRVIEDFSSADLLLGFEEEMVRRFIRVACSNNDKALSPLIRQAMDYIHNHLLEPFKAADVARSVYVHPVYLSARFKQVTGETMSEYVQRERIKEAQRMIRRGKESSSAIASACQFCSQSYFIQVFKRYTGLTPEQFRQMEGMR